MANDAHRLRRQLQDKGYDVGAPTGRGRTSYVVTDPRRGGVLVARFPTSPSSGSWLANVQAAIRRYERTGQPVRSDRIRR